MEGNTYKSLNTEESQVRKGLQESLVCRPFVWKLILAAIVINTVISVALLTMIIIIITGAASGANGLVPGTIYPSLIKAVQANTDPKQWKDP